MVCEEQQFRRMRNLIIHDCHHEPWCHPKGSDYAARAIGMAIVKDIREVMQVPDKEDRCEHLRRIYSHEVSSAVAWLCEYKAYTFQATIYDEQFGKSHTAKILTEIASCLNQRQIDFMTDSAEETYEEAAAAFVDAIFAALENLKKLLQAVLEREEGFP